MKDLETISLDQLGAVSGGHATCDLSGLPQSAQNIIMSESGNNPTAKNPTSTAFGEGQLLVANRRALMGADANSTSCSAQLGAFSKYTLGRYGSYDNAWSFHKAHGWY